LIKVKSGSDSSANSPLRLFGKGAFRRAGDRFVERRAGIGAILRARPSSAYHASRRNGGSGA